MQSPGLIAQPRLATDSRNRWPSSQTVPQKESCTSERHERFFRQYHVAEVMRGYELARDKALLDIIRTYRKYDFDLLLKFQEDNMLDILERLADYPEREILRLSEIGSRRPLHSFSHQPAMAKLFSQSRASRVSNSSRDSGYSSRPASEIDDFAAAAQDGTEWRMSVASSDTTQEPFSTKNTLSPDLSWPQDMAEHQQDYLSSSSMAHSQRHSPNTATGLAYLEPPKTKQDRLFECVYCPQDFVRPGDCLNHEETIHSQRKKWVCPHCGQQSDTKGGYDRHHKNHGCQQCTEPGQVLNLSGPKRSCACIYCGSLFQGNDCFAIRANHTRVVHYKGVKLCTKADMDYSRMIQSLLNSKELSRAWTMFRKTQSNVALRWSSETARVFVQALEFGEFPTNLDVLLQQIYDLAEKLEPLPEPTSDPSDQFGEEFSGNPWNSSMLTSRHSLNDMTDGRLGVTFIDGAGPKDDYTQSNRTNKTGAPTITTTLRTRQALNAAMLASDCNPPFSTSPALEVEHDLPPDLPVSNQETQDCSAHLRGNVFMGYGRTSPESSDAMDVSHISGTMESAYMSRIPTPPSQSLSFGHMDEALSRMGDLMSHQNMVSTHSAQPYIPPAWGEDLPPSLQIAAANASPPPAGPLPRPPPRRFPKDL